MANEVKIQIKNTSDFIVKGTKPWGDAVLRFC